MGKKSAKVASSKELAVVTEKSANALKAWERSDLDQRMRYASIVSSAGELVPAGYRNRDGSANQGKVLLAMELGTALGFPPAVCLTELYVVEGRLSISALGMQALVRSAGHRVRVWQEGSGASVKAIATVHRKDDPEFEYRSEWDASRVTHLMSKANYKNHLAQMLTSRAIGEVSRQAAPEALLGIAYTTEEVQDFEVVAIDASLPAPQSEPIATEQDAELTQAEQKVLEKMLVDAETAKTKEAIEAVGTAAKKRGWLKRRIDSNHNFEEYLLFLIGELEAPAEDAPTLPIPNEDPADPA
jgi:hypothetical protein